MQSVHQGDLELLQHPVSQELLHSKIPARLAYVWTDGTPRVIPIWFHWNGREFIMATPPKAPKLKALKKNPKVSFTIDDNYSLTRSSWSAGPPASITSTELCPNTPPPPSATSEPNRAKPGSNI